MSQYKNIASINQNRLFAGVTPDDLKVSLKQGNFLEFQEGDIIYQKGDKDDSVYLIIDGEIKLKIKQPLAGSTIIKKGRNEFFGEDEFLDKAPRSSSAVANTVCILFKLNRKDIISIGSKYKQVLKNLSGNADVPDIEDEDEQPVSETDEEAAEEFPGENQNEPDEETAETGISEPAVPERLDTIEGEQINWDEQNLREFEDQPEEQTVDREENENATSADIESDEEIKWESGGLDGLEDSTEEQLQAPDSDTGALETGTDNAWNILGDENQFNSFEDLTEEKPEEHIEETSVPENELEGGEEIKWDENQFGSIEDFENEKPEDQVEETSVPENELEGGEDIRWDENQFGTTEDFEKEKSDEHIEESNVTENEIQSSEEVKWDENQFGSLEDFEKEKTGEHIEETNVTENEIQNGEEVRWEENQFGSLEDSEKEKSEEHIEETNVTENELQSGGEVKWDENQFGTMEDFEKEKPEEHIEETNVPENELQSDEGVRWDENQLNDLKNLEEDLSNMESVIDNENIDINSGAVYTEGPEAHDESFPEDETYGEEKPTVGIYGEEEPEPGETLSDEEIYERALRDLIYLYRSKNLPDTLTTANELIKNFTGADLIRFYLVDTFNDEMDLLETEDNTVKHKRYKLKEGIVSHSVLNNEIINMLNPEEDPRFSSGTDSFGEIEINNSLCFPVNNNLNEVRALIYLANSLSGSFSGKDEKYLKIFSPHALNHMDNIGQLESIPANIQTKATGVFSNFVIEDIKIPLSIIKHYTDFIKRKAIPEEIRLVSSYMANQVDSILSFSSVISDLINDNITLNPETFKLDVLLDEILEMLAEYVDTRKVKLFKRYDSTTSVNIDKARFYHALYQITKILCSNMSEGGSIYLVTDVKNNNAVISFKNTGSGLREGIEEDLSKQFSDLSNLDELTMSLSIAKKITEDHGGKLELRRNNENGTEFLIKIPVSETDIANPEI